jgi:hypothetical protein
VMSHFECCGQGAIVLLATTGMSMLIFSDMPAFPVVLMLQHLSLHAVAKLFAANSSVCC